MAGTIKAQDIYVVLEGEVTLRLPDKGGPNLIIDHLGKGAMFGGPLGHKRRAYALSAQCTQKAKLLKIDVGVMKKPQAIVRNIPLEV